MKKKILIISYEFPPLVGGAGTYSRELAVGLSRIGFDVTIVTCHHNPKSVENEIDSTLLNKENINILRFKSISKLFFLQIRFFLIKHWGYNFQNEFSYIVLADSRSTRFAVLNFNNKQLKKSIHIFHGGEVDSFYLKPNFRIKLSGIHRKFVESLKNSLAVITVCQDLFELFKKEIPELKDYISVVLHGIDDKIFTPIQRSEIENIRNSLEINYDDILIISASRIIKSKGQDHLIKAFSMLSKDNKKLKLIIVGDGNYKIELMKLVDELELSDKITFLESVTRETLAKLMAASDIYAMLSRRKNETFGLVYIEANACGIPVLASDFAGVPEAVENGISGILANPFDVSDIASKLKIIIEPDFKEQLALSAYKRLKESFTCEVMAKNTIKVINDKERK